MNKRALESRIALEMHEEILTGARVYLVTFTLDVSRSGRLANLASVIEQKFVTIFQPRSYQPTLTNSNPTRPRFNRPM